jgi:hypothetical protein
MGELTLSLLAAAVKATVKVVVTSVVKYAISRIKERTAPISGRDGSKDKK